MKQKLCSILNDVIGPIMTGPSSSHTAGCARIGRMTSLLYGREVKSVEIVFDSQGSYPNTYVGQGSNYGFAGGLMGFMPEDPRLKNAMNIAEESGIRIRFSQSDLGARHPNQAEIKIYGESEKLEMSVMTYSTGGGMFEITEMDGFEVSITGDKKKVYIACTNEEAVLTVSKLLNAISIYKKQKLKNIVLFEVEPSNHFDDSVILIIKETPGVKYVRIAEVILPVAIREALNPPFSCAEEALEYNTDKDKALWQLAVEYECSISDIEERQLFEKMKNVLEIMRSSIIPIQKNKLERTGFLEPTAYLMSEQIKSKKTIDMGLASKIMIWSTAVMENSCAHNIIVAAPTAGSSGVLPASIIGVGEELGVTDDEMIKSLLAAGLVGVFIANQATFGAEQAACQAENGAASAMAAAGLIEMLNGSPLEGFKAASLALQNLLGLVCDPVGGLTEIPCVSRNVAASLNAVASANMVICGFDPIIPFDETIVAMMEIGYLMPKELRCTCEGGLCETPTGRRIMQEIIDKRRNNKNV